MAIVVTSTCAVPFNKGLAFAPDHPLANFNQSSSMLWALSDSHAHLLEVRLPGHSRSVGEVLTVAQPSVPQANCLSVVSASERCVVGSKRGTLHLLSHTAAAVSESRFDSVVEAVASLQGHLSVAGLGRGGAALVDWQQNGTVVGRLPHGSVVAQVTPLSPHSVLLASQAGLLLWDVRTSTASPLACPSHVSSVQGEWLGLERGQVVQLEGGRGLGVVHTVHPGEDDVYVAPHALRHSVLSCTGRGTLKETRGEDSAVLGAVSGGVLGLAVDTRLNAVAVAANGRLVVGVLRV
jgi:hypothetical protein